MLTYVTYADIFQPAEKKLAGLYNLILVIAASLLIGISAQIAVILPFSPVPVTAQTFAVLMIAALLGRRRAALTVLAYIAQGAAGLPVFSLGKAGLPILVGPTGGYLAGFIAAAYVVGMLAEKGWDRRISTTILAMMLGNIIIYTFGMFGLMAFTGPNKTVLIAGLYPFIVGDCLKIALAAMILPAGWKILKLARPSEEKIKKQHKKC